MCQFCSCLDASIHKPTIRFVSRHEAEFKDEQADQDEQAEQADQADQGCSKFAGVICKCMV